MKKLDIAKEVSTRKYERPPRIVYFFYRVILDVVYRRFKQKYIRKDNIGKEKGGCLVLFNHLSRLDHYYMMRATWPKRMTMIAEYNEFFRSHLHWVFKMEQIVPKKNYCSDIVTIKAIFKLLKKNACIALAPEGLATNDGTPKPIVPGTGHLIKKCKVPVYLAFQQGQYLQNTKTCLDIRYGHTEVTTSLLFSKEDIEKLSAEEIENKINDAFHHDEYAWNKENHNKYETSGRVCEKIEDLIFECPKCHSMFKSVGSGNTFKCTECGNGFTQDDYYDIMPFDGSLFPETISDWVHKERIHIIRDIRRDESFSFKEKCSLSVLPNDHYLTDYKTGEKVSDGEITIDHTGVHFKGNNSLYDFDISYKEIYTVITCTDSSNFSIYVNGEYREITPERHTVLYMSMLIEEMHRLHENFYKNFKWNEYMYDERNWD